MVLDSLGVRLLYAKRGGHGWSGCLVEGQRVMPESEMRFPQFQPIQLRLLQVISCVCIIVLREIFFGHGLIVRDILPIGKVLLSLL